MRNNLSLIADEKYELEVYSLKNLEKLSEAAISVTATVTQY